MDKIRFQQILRRVILVPVTIALFLAITLVLEVRYLMTISARVEHSDQVISLAQRIYRGRVDQETGLRAFLLTKDNRFLQPFLDGLTQDREIEVQLSQMISGNPQQQERNKTALEAFQRWSAWAQVAIARAKVGQEVTDVPFQLQGKDLMDKYRDARMSFITAEQHLRDAQLGHSRNALHWVNSTIIALCIAIGAALAAFGRRQLVVLSQNFGAALDKAEASTREAQAQKEWLQTTLRSIGDAVIATDAEGAITFMNPVAENLTGWTVPEAAGKPLPEVFRIFNEYTRELVENPVDKVRRLNKVVGLANHTILISKDGKEFAIDDSGAPIRGDHGSIIGIVLVFRDVTQQRKLETALQSNERLAVAGRLSASIAHEIHNPLDTIGNILFLIGQKADNRPELQQLVGTAQTEVYRVAQISKNMLSLHRDSRSPSPVRISEMLDSVVSLIDETIAKGKRRFWIEHGFDGEIQGFPAELRQVFTNIIKNAVEATSEGGSIRVFTVPGTQDKHAGVLVHVVDDGSGIPEEMKSRLFSPFATSKETNGSGLGLWVSQSIVEKHGGTIHITSNSQVQRRGTTVTVFLPLEVADHLEPENEASSAAS
ncbi:MAG: ATP-binding protein [Terriglobia bacterium]|jgi:PAS domain S-box-containing protein|nr:ATP-binding protein [Terriglobia bacterium]